MADFEYFRAEESDQFSFFRIPKFLFTRKRVCKSVHRRKAPLWNSALTESACPRKMAGLTVRVMSISFTRSQNCRSCANVAYDSDKASI